MALIRRRIIGPSFSHVAVPALAGVAANLALDGSGFGTSFATTTNATLTTTSTNDIILACIACNGGGILSVADVAGLSWSTIAYDFAGGTALAFWYAKSASVLTGDVITVTVSGDYTTIHVFGVSGSNFASPLDGNGALPYVTSPTEGEHIFLTTTTPDGFLFAGYRLGSDNPTAGTGWTTIQGNNFMLTEYKIVSSPQTALEVPIGVGDGTSNKGIGHSIRA